MLKNDSDLFFFEDRRTLHIVSSFILKVYANSLIAHVHERLKGGSILVDTGRKTHPPSLPLGPMPAMD